MSDWVDVRNFGDLMRDYQKSQWDSTNLPGLGTYLKEITRQNDEIIALLKKIAGEKSDE